MPSSKNYIRDYQQEYKTESKARRKYRSERNKARQIDLKKGLVHKHDGMDVDHRIPLSKGGSSDIKNTRVVKAHKNRSYARTKSGKIK